MKVLSPRMVSSFLASSIFTKKLVMFLPSSMVMPKHCCWTWCMLSYGHWSCFFSTYSKLPLRSCNSWCISRFSFQWFDTKAALFDYLSWSMQQDLPYLMMEALELCHLPCPSTPFKKNKALIWNYQMWKFCLENLLIFFKTSLTSTMVSKKKHTSTTTWCNTTPQKEYSNIITWLLTSTTTWFTKILYAQYLGTMDQWKDYKTTC
jgi:hypothetical protein